MDETIDLIEQNKQWEYLKRCIEEGHPARLDSIGFERGLLQITINGYTYQEKDNPVASHELRSEYQQEKDKYNNR